VGAEVRGEIVHRIVEDGHVFEVEKLPAPFMKNGYARNFRLWKDAKPCVGGQWHYTRDGAIRRARYELEEGYKARITFLEMMVSCLERKLAIAAGITQEKISE